MKMFIKHLQLRVYDYTSRKPIYSIINVGEMNML